MFGVVFRPCHASRERRHKPIVPPLTPNGAKAVRSVFQQSAKPRGHVTNRYHVFTGDSLFARLTPGVWQEIVDRENTNQLPVIVDHWKPQHILRRHRLERHPNLFIGSAAEDSRKRDILTLTADARMAPSAPQMSRSVIMLDTTLRRSTTGRAPRRRTAQTRCSVGFQ
jgi:hypothetical protein